MVAKLRRFDEPSVEFYPDLRRASCMEDEQAG
jgi:hypothetical protein